MVAVASRKQPGLAFWATVVVVAGLVLYPLSFGPACWWFAGPQRAGLFCAGFTDRYAPIYYWPIGWLADRSPLVLHDAIIWYARLGGRVAIPYDRDGDLYLYVP